MFFYFMDKKVPHGVKIISVLYVLGILFYSLSKGIFYKINPFIVVIYLFFMAIVISIAVGLWKGNKVARGFVITFGVYGVIYYFINLVSSVGSLLEQIVGLLIALIVFSYIMFSKEVKTFFG